MKEELYADTYMRVAKTQEGFKHQQAALFKLGYAWGTSGKKIQSRVGDYRHLHLVTGDGEKTILWKFKNHIPEADLMVTLCEEVTYSIEPLRTLINVCGKNYRERDVKKALEALETVHTFKE